MRLFYAASQEVGKGKAKLHESFQRRMSSSMPTQPSGSLQSPPGESSLSFHTLPHASFLCSNRQHPNGLGPVQSATLHDIRSCMQGLL